MHLITVVFTAKEILQEIHRELLKVGADTENISVEKWQQYILARTVEDVLLVDLTPQFNPSMETTALIVRSNYRRRNDDDHFFTIQQDVGSKLFSYLSSSDLSFESQLELYRNRITIGARTSTG